MLGWALLEEESTAVRLAIADARSCTELTEPEQRQESEVRTASWWGQDQDNALSEWMLAEVCVDLLCQQIRGSYTAARYRACLPRLQRFLCTGHRKRPHLYSQVCHWLQMPAPTLQERTMAS